MISLGFTNLGLDPNALVHSNLLHRCIDTHSTLLNIIKEIPFKLKTLIILSLISFMQVNAHKVRK